MDIALARIDDRLIHGQIVAAWLQAIGRCDEILVCDDPTRRDPFLRTVMETAAPPGLPVRVMTVDEAIAAFRAQPNSSRRVLLLTRGPVEMMRLIHGGVPVRQVNLGSMGSMPGRRSLFRYISASDEELAALREIHSQGVSIELKMVPSERGVDFAELDGDRRR